MKVLITGSNGYLGMHLVPYLDSLGHELILLQRNSQINFKNLHKHEIIDLESRDWKVKISNSKPDVVLHLAAYLSSNDDEETISRLIESNITFGTQLLDALRNTKLKLFINTGSFSEYFSNSEKIDPTYLYAATKSAFRYILKYFSSINNFSVLNVIPYTIYGGTTKQKKIFDLIYDSLDSNNSINMSPGDQQLDFIHIEDVLRFFSAALKNTNHFVLKEFSEVHLGTGIGTTPKQIAALFENITCKKANIKWGGLSYRKRDTLFAVANKFLPEPLLCWTPQVKLINGIENYIKLKKS